MIAARYERRTLQWTLFLIWLTAFGISIVTITVRFFGIIFDYQNFLGAVNIKRCTNGAVEKIRDLCTSYANDVGVDVFDQHWQAELLSNLLENVAQIYLPILAVMLATFLSATHKYRAQMIRRDQFLIASCTFGIIHLMTVLVVVVFVFFSGALTDANIPNLLATAFSVVMGIVVGFSFPESTNGDYQESDTSQPLEKRTPMSPATRPP